MNQIIQQDWEILKNTFQLDCIIDDVSYLGNGHINETYLVDDPSGKWVLQKINNSVFPNPLVVQQNFDKISAHIANKPYPLINMQARKTHSGYTLALVKGNSWRLTQFIENCAVLDKVKTTQQAYTAAAAIGEFDKALSDLSVKSITPVIEGFHDLQLRLNQFNQSLLRNFNNRVADCNEELALIREFANLADWIPKAKANHLLQPRIVHNDTKISNILIHQHTGVAKAVIDWDTVMPGYYLYDYGDMVRSFAPIGGEDTPELSELRWEMLEALTEGFISSCGKVLSPFEKQNLLVGAEIIIFMIGVRFLTDHFNGDTYFAISRDNQNLDRAKTQFALLKQLRASKKIWQKKLGLDK